MDGKKMEAQRPMKIIRDEVLSESEPDAGESKINMAVIFLIITLVVIAIVVFIYIYNKSHNSTKEIINQNIKENGTN
jgi:flagellar basal body-associated protein FliL